MLDIKRIQELIRQLWKVDVRKLHGLRRLQFISLRILYAIIRDIITGQLSLRAMSLVYTTLLSLVPLLAVSFSVLKAFGVHNEVRPLVYNFLAPLGEKGVEVGDKIMGFVENIQVGVLGAIGLALLLFTVVSLLQKIERSFNYIWRIERPRRITRRFSDYLSVILVGPVLVFTAIAITASVKTAVLMQAGDVKILSDGVEFVGKLAPYLLIIAAFTFVYIFMPNTKVRFLPAFIGAIVAGVLWESLGWLFASFVVSSTNYAAIYSSFAILILFMLWIYLGWVILLVGVEVSFYVQNPLQILSPDTPARLSHADEQKLTLAIMSHCGHAFQQGNNPPTSDALSENFGVTPILIDEIVGEMLKAKLLVETNGEVRGLVPARDMQTIYIADILAAIDGKQTLSLPANSEILATANIMDKLNKARMSVVGNQSLQELVAELNNHN